LLGLQHSFDADHVAAISTIVSKNKSLAKALAIGAAWGVGHSGTLLIIGLFVLGLKVTIPDKLAQGLEFLVGLMLIYLGFGLLKSIVVDRIHMHRHKHGEVEHMHFHSHKTSKKHEHLHRPLLVGMVHGVAGSAAVMLLIMATMTSVGEGLLFALVFGVGSILGMMVAGMIISLPVLVAQKYASLSQTLMAIAGFVSTGVGFMVIKENWPFS
jgi:sulfite exporter TauE/SafE